MSATIANSVANTPAITIPVPGVTMFIDNISASQPPIEVIVVVAAPLTFAQAVNNDPSTCANNTADTTVDTIASKYSNVSHFALPRPGSVAAWGALPI